MSAHASDPPGGATPGSDPANAYYRRPRLLALTLALVLVSGLSAWQLLPRAEDPALSDRVARIVTAYPGASPARVEALVTETLEEELLEVSALRLVRSESRRGVSLILLELADEVDDTASAWADVRAAVDDAKPRLPAGAGEPELEVQDILAYTLIAAVTWEGPGSAPQGVLRRLAKGLEERLRAVPETKDVELYGAVDEEVHVTLDPVALVGLGRSAGDVAAALRGGDAKVAAGQLQGPRDELLLEVTGELDSLERIRAVPVRQGADGRVVRVGDVARVERGVRDPADQQAIVGGRPAVAVAARMRADGHVDRGSAPAHGVLEQYRRDLPREVALEVLFDQSRYTAQRLDSLAWNLLLGVAGVMAVMFLAMGWRSALLVGIALPLTSLLVLAGLRLLEVPLQQMSVTGLIIALGLLIDNAIVMVDEVEHRLRAGAPPASAVSQAVRHLAIPLGSSTVTTALAFMPMVLMPGPAGEFVGSIGLSVILALTSSLFLSLTVLPAIAGLLAKTQGGAAAAGASSLPHFTGLRHAGLLAAYRGWLDRMLARPGRAAALSAALPLAGFAAAAGLQEQFFPPADRDQLQVELRLPAHAALAETERTAARARERLLAHPAVEQVHWFLGRTAPKFYYNMLAGQDGAPFYAQGLVQLKRSEGAREVVRALQAELDRAAPEAQAMVKLLEQGPPFEAPVELHLYGDDLERLRALGEEARRVLAALPDVVQTRATLGGAEAKLRVEVDEEEGRLAGLEPVTVAAQLEHGLVGAPGGSLLEGTERLPVRVRVAGARGTPRAVESLALFAGLPAAADGPPRAAIPVASLAELDLQPRAGTIVRRNGRRVNTVQGFLRAGVLPSTGLAAYRAALEAEGFDLPPGVTAEIGGESQERDRAVGNLLASAGVLLVLMVATLVLGFDSFRQAALIATVGALSVGLALGALWIGGSPFGFMAIVGTMGLIGVAINDAIVVLAAIRDDPRAARGDPAALREVVVRSTRHVVATTLTTMAGFAPLLLAGGEFWRPLALAIAGGVAGATLLALTFVPAAFRALVGFGMRCPIADAPSAAAGASCAGALGFALPSSGGGA